MKAFVKTMKALSDPNRVKIVKMLERRNMCVCELQAALKIAQPTVSKHLKILEEAGFVTFDKDGLWVNYRLSDGSHNPYVASLLGNLKHWMEDDGDVRELMARLPLIRREAICGR